MVELVQSAQTVTKSDTVTVNREIEVKLLAEPGKLQSALKLPALAGIALQPRARTLDTIYYDNKVGALQNAGVALRVRRAYGRHIMTVKFPASLSAGMFGRDEIEVRIPSAKPDIEKFGSDVAARIRQIIGQKPSRILNQIPDKPQSERPDDGIMPAFATVFKRRTGMLIDGITRIELALDSGTIEASGKKQSLDEIELELKEGNETTLYELASVLAREGGLRLSPMTKAQRGSLLATNASPGACKASVPELPPSIVLDDFIAAVINQCLGQFVANWPAAEAGIKPEGVHQARVSLRRLRAMLGLFIKTIPAPEFRIFMAEAKQIANAMGPARDWDVFIEMLKKGPMTVNPQDKGFQILLAAASERREQSYNNIRKLLSDPVTTCFVLDLRAFAARRGWRYVLSGAELPVLGEAARTFCSRTMSRLHKKALRQGKQIAALNIEERHDLRKELKRLRYSAEFCSPFFGTNSGLKRYSRAAGRLQDVLGAYNDQAVGLGLLDTLEADTGASRSRESAARAAGIVLGWCARGGAVAGPELKLTWERFAGTRRFWS